MGGDIRSFFGKSSQQKRSSQEPTDACEKKEDEIKETKKPRIDEMKKEEPIPEKPIMKAEKKEEKRETKKKTQTKKRIVVASDSDKDFEVQVVPKKRGRKMNSSDDDIPQELPPKKKASRKKSKLIIEENSDHVPENSEKKVAKVVEKRAIAGSYRPKWVSPNVEPPKHGMKWIPTGREDCLSGLVFVLSGLNESLTRDEMSTLIQKYGGEERTAVSKKTSYLVAGFQMEDGRAITEGSKYRNAVEKGVKIISEDDLLDMIRKSDPEASARQKEEEEKKKAEEEENMRKRIQEEKEDEKKREEEASKTITKSRKRYDDKTILTSKYAPKEMSDIIGNKQAIENLRLWLEDWDAVHIKKTKTIAYNRQNPGAPAVLISGPPGIGKTTTATLLCRQYEYDIVELNASDKRNMSIIRDTLRDSVTTAAFCRDEKEKKKKVVLMDEVDGMSSGDRGGIQELIRVIKTTRIPIICICNDHESPKVRSLASSCYDLQFNKPISGEIIKRLRYICAKEELDLDNDCIFSMVESTNGDFRQILNQLQILISIKQTNSDLSSLSSIVKSFSKDQLLGLTPFEACRSLLCNSSLSVNQRYDMFFSDYEMTPLLLQQNYLDCIKSNGNSVQSIDQLVEASDAFCDIEHVHEVMMKTNTWSLLPTISILSVRAGALAHGRSVFTRFPMALGKYSSIRKNLRLSSELLNHVNTRVSASHKSLTLDYFEYLNRHIVGPLLEDNVVESIERMDEYGITKDDLVITLNRTGLGGEKSLFDTVPSKTKGSLTRLYNSGTHKSANVFADADSIFKKVTKGKKGKSKGEKSSETVEAATAEDTTYDDNDDAYLAF